ncbi:hypothetical protein ACFYSC_16250 [Streptosporangium sp. NPDC004379]|uniref:hypothetical protein n=1 Tax=Streptosporangium sp. NPDC004379 TaxID=3366189 RepID=UPI00367C813C
MPSTLHLPRTRVALAAFACLAGLLAGCGNADESSGTPNNSSGAASDSDSAGTADQKYTEWEAKFRSCLSDKGFELPKEAGKIDFGDRQDAYEVAREACIKKIGKPPTAADDQPAMSDEEAKEKELKTLQCLRDHGYNVKDPAPGEAAQVEVPDGVSQDGLKECYGE